MSLAVHKSWIGEDGKKWQTIISSDGSGYYAYLPAIFIYQDLTFIENAAAENKLSDSIEKTPGYLITRDNVTVNKYFPGVALLWFPFFLLACLLTFITGNEMTGYSFFFQIMMSVSAIFYVFFGLNCLRKFLLQEKISDSIIAFVLAAILFGTNLYYYTVIQPAMSHAFSFAMIAAFLFMIQKSIGTLRLKDIVAAAFLLGIIITIRPVNVMILLAVPMVAGNQTSLKRFIVKLLSTPKTLLLSFLGFCAPVLLIPVLLWVQTGSPFYWSYQGEGFYFGDPRVREVLFSFRKGLFIFTPLCFLAILGLFPLYKKNPFRAAAFILFFAVITYVISSWWQWYYGDSFGHRAFIDFYAVFALLLALLLGTIQSSHFKIFVFTVTTALIALNQGQAYQYEHFILHRHAMNFEKYKEVFLKIAKEHRYTIHGELDAPPFGKLVPFHFFENDFETVSSEWDNSVVVENKDAFSGKYVSLYHEGIEYGNTFTSVMDSSWITKRPMFVSAFLMKKELELNACRNARLVISIEDSSGKTIYWNGIYLNELPSKKINEWRLTQGQFYFPVQTKVGNILKCYIWNPEGGNFMIDNLNIRFYKVYPSHHHAGFDSYLLR